ncbi:hypothetical protein AB6A40_004033 [Gnathostoma spinigerum]|uniref:Glycine-rich protein n=1 Tax=Gnathostoma spinigerum TaxID=75299 RepID=A0ABD6EBA1_9BILA
MTTQRLLLCFVLGLLLVTLPIEAAVRVKRQFFLGGFGNGYDNNNGGVDINNIGGWGGWGGGWGGYGGWGYPYGGFYG